MNKVMAAVAAAALGLSGAAGAQPHGSLEDVMKAFTFTRIPAVPEPEAISLYPQPTGSASTEIWDRMGNGQRVVRNVTQPTLTPVLPAVGKASGAAVIVAPGGGFTMLSMDNEGWSIAHWLADHGVAAFVLKYRLLPTPADEAESIRETMPKIIASMNSKAPPPDIKAPLATADGIAAVRLVRANAVKWGVDSTRIGMIGFSAGAMTTMRTVLEGAPGDRPNFFGYIYGPM
jgi:acetyl esterase/lipase